MWIRRRAVTRGVVVLAPPRTGALPRTRVPPPRSDRTSKRPSTAASRSAMPCRPVPPWSGCGEIEPGAVVDDVEHEVAVDELETDGCEGGVRSMFAHVLQCFEAAEVHRGLDVGSRPQPGGEPIVELGGQVRLGDVREQRRHRGRPRRATAGRSRGRGHAASPGCRRPRGGSRRARPPTVPGLAAARRGAGASRRRAVAGHRRGCRARSAAVRRPAPGRDARGRREGRPPGARCGRAGLRVAS